MSTLILGGTAEARALAADLATSGVDVVSSLAGAVSRPRLPAGQVRIGGFGGVTGLVQFLRDNGIHHVVDATHPFAATMTAHAATAADQTGIPLLRLLRPGWRDHPDAHTWAWVADHSQAARVGGATGTRPFLTIGRQQLGQYLAWADRPVLARVVEPPAIRLPASWQVIQDRGPYDEDAETALMREHGIDLVITKDSGGSYTAAKLTAAGLCHARVLVIVRPGTPDGVPVVASAAAAADWVRRRQL